MDDKDIEKIKYGIYNKIITLCETCDTTFPYSPQKKFCDECNKERQRINQKIRRERYANDPEFREKTLKTNREYRDKRKREDPEWYERRCHRNRRK